MSPNKSITIITGNYFPEDTAIGLYTTQFAKYLQKKGYNVTIITGFPYYPKWEIFENYKNKSKYYYEKIDNIDIFRYKIYLPKKVTFIGRIKLMISFLYGAIKNYKRIENTDLVICIVPFTLSIIPSFFLAKKFKTKLWIHVQDFEFDLAFESGIFKNKAVSNILKFFIFNFEKKLLKKADVLSSISNNMLSKATLKAPLTEKFFFPNWVSSEKINPLYFKPHPYISNEKFSLLYSGNIGNKQDWETLINLLPLINDNTTEIVIVGQGAFENELKEKCKSYSFVKFFDPVPYNELNDLLCSADLHFLFQKTDVVDTVMPSKILGMMASGKPSIITGNKNSEVKLIFNQAKCGYYFSNNNIKDINKSINILIEQINLCKEFGKQGREYVISNFSEATILSNTSNKINELLKN